MGRGAAFLVLAAALAGSVAWAGQPAQPQGPAQAQAQTEAQPAPDPAAVLQGACSACHGVDFIAEHRKDRADWDFTVHRMIDKGADIDPDTAALLIDYLARTYPKPPAAPAAPA